MPFPDSVPVDWRRQLSKLVDVMPLPLIEGIPAMKSAVDEARVALSVGADQETCKALYEKVSQSRLQK